MTAYITKYALSKGILMMQVDQSTECPSMVSSREKYNQCFHGEGREWHRTIGSAKARAEHMRLNKIASLKNQIDKLKALEF